MCVFSPDKVDGVLHQQHMFGPAYVIGMEVEKAANPKPGEVMSARGPREEGYNPRDARGYAGDSQITNISTKCAAWASAAAHLLFSAALLCEAIGGECRNLQNARYRMPAEWAPHAGYVDCLARIYAEDWPGKFQPIPCGVLRDCALACRASEDVHILVRRCGGREARDSESLRRRGANLSAAALSSYGARISACGLQDSGPNLR